MSTLAGLVLFLPRLIRLLVRLLVDARVSRFDRALVLAALAYLASPLDVIPDLLPVVGGADDLILLTAVLLRLLRRAGPERLREHWDGREDIIRIVEAAARLAAMVLPRRLRWFVPGSPRAADPVDVR